MVRPRALNVAQLDNLLYRNKRNLSVSHYSTVNSTINLSRDIIISKNILKDRNFFLFPGIILKRNIYTCKIYRKNLESSTQQSSNTTSQYFPQVSDIKSTDSSLYLDKSIIPSIHLNQEHSSLPESDTFLEDVRSTFLKNLEDISLWLKTNRHCYIKDIDESVVQLLKNAEKFSSVHGLLLGDVLVEDLKNHISSIKSVASLFSPQFIRKQKKKLYGDNDLPLLLNPTSDQDSKNGNDDELLNHKRQELIEKLSFSEAFESAKVEASNLLDFKHPSELSSLSRTCSQWIEDISTFIKKDREKGGNFVIPLQLEEEILATTTVKIVLQSMCFPSYTFDSKGNKGGLLKKKIQQTTSNQVLITHLAIKLGEEIGKLYTKITSNGDITKDAVESLLSKPESDDACETKDEYIEIKTVSNTSENKDNNVVVKSNLNAVVEPLQTTDAKRNNWNTSQSAAVGGYLLNALIKSCKVELDLQTALKQYLSNYSYYFNQNMNKSQNKGVGSSPKSKNNKVLKEKGKDLVEFENKGDELEVVESNGMKMKQDKAAIIMRFLNVIKKSRFNESLVEVEAFRHVLLRQGIKTFGVLEMRESCMLQLRDFVAKSLVSLAALPMVCKPKRWSSATSGGSLLLKHNFIRGSNLNEVKVYNLESVFEIVNKFSQVPWIINSNLLNLIKVINNNHTNIPIKQFMPYNPNPIQLVSGMDLGNIVGVSQGPLQNNGNLKSEELSELSLFLRRIKIADTFAKEKRLYLPLNIDFRGRMYPLSPYLNHMNDDLCRSLLLFSEKRKLGERGLFWLKIHISNMYGNDKISFDHRIRWVEEHMGIIRDLVRNPFNDFNQNFWAKAEKPFQFYSSCIELVNAIETNNPVEYSTHLPIQQDGTCNGLQHYAALGLDELGAKYVNLVDSDHPLDLYSHVLQLVIQKVYQDSQSNPSSSSSLVVTKVKPSGKVSNAENSKKYSKICVENNVLCRKVIKQTVMTICYGVTRIGAIDQVESKLKDIKKLSSLSPTELRGLAAYLANKILSSITTIFSEAMSIKNWLDEISCVHNRFNVPVTWISPMGLPCEQPYCKSVTKVVRTPLQAINISKYVSSVDKKKQKLAFPPNFIHSLDASHLMMTAKQVFKHTYSFASVHDSYWIHPDKVDLMHKYIRSEFVNMHNQPILHSLHTSLVNKLQINFRPPPKKGTFNLENVLQSRYFFH